MDFAWGSDGCLTADYVMGTFGHTAPHIPVTKEERGWCEYEYYYEFGNSTYGGLAVSVGIFTTPPSWVDEILDGEVLVTSDEISSLGPVGIIKDHRGSSRNFYTLVSDFTIIVNVEPTLITINRYDPEFIDQAAIEVITAIVTFG